MTCLIFGGVMDACPNIKIVIHHGGAMIPFFDQRIFSHPGNTSGLKKPLLDYYRMFYADTALQGSIGGVYASYKFFGSEHVLLGTDMPQPPSSGGKGYTREAVASIESQDIPAEHKELMLSGNILRITGS
jgi:aminocarboxymuconate-semialdehyde decarboxylase